MAPAPTDEFFLNPTRVRRSFERAAATYDAAAAVQGEIRDRLLERLDIVKLQPQVVLDLGAGTGRATRELRRRYAAQVIAFDVSAAMLRQAGQQQAFLKRFQRVQGDAHRLPFRTGSVDLIFSNLLLEWCHDPDQVFREMRRLLRPGGLLTFTTLGPDTLRELRESWRTVDTHTHVHRFIDMHDLGDALVRAGYAEPVMDVERLTVTYPDLAALIQELKATGSSNRAAGASSGLTGRSRWSRFETAGAGLLRNGVIPASVEVVYGQAWTGEPRKSEVRDGEIRVPLTTLQRKGARNHQ
jgi:malonyl-CoA O-methyltransferase